MYFLRQNLIHPLISFVFISQYKSRYICIYIYRERYLYFSAWLELCRFVCSLLFHSFSVFVFWDIGMCVVKFTGYQQIEEAFCLLLLIFLFSYFKSQFLPFYCRFRGEYSSLSNRHSSIVIFIRLKQISDG